MMAPPFYLELISGVGAGSGYPLDDGQTSIGRNPANTVVLPPAEKLVSGYHAIIYRTGSTVILQDTNSTNGTFVNGEKISDRVLAPGDVIGLGKQGPRLRLITADSDADGIYLEKSAKPGSIYSEIPDTEVMMNPFDSVAKGNIAAMRNSITNRYKRKEGETSTGLPLV